MTKLPKEILNRENVYVIGAGFSHGLGYPLTSHLLLELWVRLRKPFRRKLHKVIKFHQPSFNPSRRTTFPNIEQLLTEIAVNEDLFLASRPYEGKFTKEELVELKEELLSEIAVWFHSFYEEAIKTPWLLAFVERLRKERAAIISFNWDLLLDHLLFAQTFGAQAYGLAQHLDPATCFLLKPHGSLNWYHSQDVQKVKAEKRVQIFSGSTSQESIEAFLYPRAISSKFERRYMPLIVAPTYLKDFKKPVFQLTWNRCVGVLSTAKRLFFLGYSLPHSDLQAKFILRCGFHNQVEGLPAKEKRRRKATGRSEIFIVNPDQGAAARIEEIAGPGYQCQWVEESVERWLSCL